jgi:hypothetical protein
LFRASAVSVVALSLLLASGVVSASEPSASESGSFGSSYLGQLGFAPVIGGVSSGFGLLDPARLDVQRSVSFSFSSAGGAQGLQGLFLNRFQYRLADPLTAWVDVGYAFRPGLGQDAQGEGSLTIPSFGMSYRPSESLLFQFNYRDFRYAPPGVLPYRY